MAEEVTAEKVTFVNQNNKSFKVNLFGPKKNRVRVATVLAAFEASQAFLADDSVMEADDEGLSMDTFAAGVTYNLTVRPVVPQAAQQDALDPFRRLLVEANMDLRIPEITELKAYLLHPPRMEFPVSQRRYPSVDELSE